MVEVKPVRCAVYTRKSSEEGLEQSFNSLHAQREACEAYILSQKHEGWQLIPAPYDDGGYSGGSMERPGLKALLADVEAGLIDTVVVYKVDRLTRALSDFAKMVDRFDARSVSFVSVTQAFNTTTSMGRLTLNVLLSFAQFEREVTGERIRDKIAASKAKGMWMGGSVPLGYDVVDRQLVVNEPEAAQVRELFALYLKFKSVDDVVTAAAAAKIRSKQRLSAAGNTTGGSRLGRGSLYAILANPLYAGEVGHKGKRYPGQHQRIVEPDVFEAVQVLLAGNRRKGLGTAASTASSLLTGMVEDHSGTRMTATYTGKADRRYRYYASTLTRVPADELETLVGAAIVDALGSPARLASVLPSLDLLTAAVIDKATSIAGAWQQRDHADRRHLATQLIERVQVTGTGVLVVLNLKPIGSAGTAEIVVPATIGKAKARLSLVVPGSAAPKPDQSLISAVAQARRWLLLLTTGKCTSIGGIAAADKVTPGYVRQLIGAAYLAPDIVTRIVEGRQPAWLTLASLKDMMPLPADWAEQRQLFARQN